MPNSVEDDLNTIKTSVEILKRDILTIQTFSVKIDDAIEKMTEVYNSISKMLIIHEHNHDQLIENVKALMYERKVDFDKQIETVNRRIHDMKSDNYEDREKHHKELLAEIKKVSDSSIDLDERMSVLERWKWLVIGGASVIGFIAARVPWDTFL
jgi:chromosome segregation ATPase